MSWPYCPDALSLTRYSPVPSSVSKELGSGKGSPRSTGWVVGRSCDRLQSNASALLLLDPSSVTEASWPLRALMMLLLLLLGMLMRATAAGGGGGRAGGGGRGGGGLGSGEVDMTVMIGTGEAATCEVLLLMLLAAGTAVTLLFPVLLLAPLSS